MHKYKQDALLGLFDALRLFPFAFAVGVCSGFGIIGGLCAALCAVVFGAVFGCALCPSWLTLLPVFAVAFRFGSGAASVCILIAGVFAFLLSFLPQSVRDSFFVPSVQSGFLLAAAFTATALHTTDYFGIGAIGGTVTEILKDYVSLGFHPNWRGILYGTIVMVVLITYPRKFKSLSRKISPAFAALLITFPLHLLLVPHAEGSPIDEIGAFTVRDLFSGAFFPGTFSPDALPMLFCSALSLALLWTQKADAHALRALSVSSLFGGMLGGVPLSTDGSARRPLSAVVTVVVTAVLFAVPSLERMPVHSLAVLLIVTAWQTVDWGGIRRAFVGGLCNIFPFLLSVLLTVFVGVHYAVPLLCCLSVLLHSQKKGSSPCSTTC